MRSCPASPQGLGLWLHSPRRGHPGRNRAQGSGTILGDANPVLAHGQVWEGSGI